MSSPRRRSPTRERPRRYGHCNVQPNSVAVAFGRLLSFDRLRKHRPNIGGTSAEHVALNPGGAIRGPTTDSRTPAGDMTESATAIGGAERSQFVHRIWPAIPATWPPCAPRSAAGAAPAPGRRERPAAGRERGRQQLRRARLHPRDRRRDRRADLLDRARKRLRRDRRPRQVADPLQPTHRTGSGDRDHAAAHPRGPLPSRPPRYPGTPPPSTAWPRRAIRGRPGRRGASIANALRCSRLPCAAPPPQPRAARGPADRPHAPRERMRLHPASAGRGAGGACGGREPCLHPIPQASPIMIYYTTTPWPAPQPPRNCETR